MRSVFLAAEGLTAARGAGEGFLFAGIAMEISDGLGISAVTPFSSMARAVDVWIRLRCGSFSIRSDRARAWHVSITVEPLRKSNLLLVDGDGDVEGERFRVAKI